MEKDTGQSYKYLQETLTSKEYEDFKQEIRMLLPLHFKSQLIDILKLYEDKISRKRI